MQSFPSLEETSLGVLDYDTVATALQQNMKKKKKEKKRKNNIFSEEERYLIGKHASVHGPGTTVKKFIKSHSHLNFGESAARSLRAKYQELLKSKTEGELASIPQLKQGRSGKLDENVKLSACTEKKRGSRQYCCGCCYSRSLHCVKSE